MKVVVYSIQPFEKEYLAKANQKKHDIKKIEVLSLDEVLGNADIISLHLPLNATPKHLINASTITKMKDGVMLINTSRGALIKTIDAIKALEQGKTGYLGLDVYEYERGLFVEGHQQDLIKDPLLEKLMAHPNVLVTPHQAFLTYEALQQIAEKTIGNLDEWRQQEQQLMVAN